MSAKLCVPAGASDQASAGETSAPSQVNFFGMLAPGSKAVLESFMATADPPFGWPAPEGAKTADRISTASTVNSQNCLTGNISPVRHASPGARTGQAGKSLIWRDSLRPRPRTIPFEIPAAKAYLYTARSE